MDVLMKNPFLIKKVQEEQLEILREFDEICRLNGLEYQIFAGSLLGAVRHGGFIPWDDDIDVAMPRKDYEEFIIIAKESLNKDKYFLQNIHTDPNTPFLFTKIRKNETVFLEKNIKHLNIHHGIFLDIFPLDNTEETRYGNWRTIIISKMLKLNTVLFIDEEAIEPKNRPLKRFLNKIFGVRMQFFLKKRIDTLLKKMSNREAKYVTHFTNGYREITHERYLMKKSDLYDSIEMDFEDIKVYAPRKYDYYLTQLYGDYLQIPKKEEQKPHHGVIELRIGEELWKI